MSLGRVGCYDPRNGFPDTKGVNVFRPSHGRPEREPGKWVALMIVSLTLLAVGVVVYFCYRIYYAG